jgi:signal transduction histidine kinase
MINKLHNLTKNTSWQSKLILSCSSAIFFTFTLFSLLEYNSVSKWMLKREEQVVNRTLTDISSYYKGRTKTDIKNSAEFLRRMNDKDQLIRIYDQNGKVLISDKNGIFPSLEPAPANVKSMEQVTEEERETIIARYPLKLDHFQGTIEIVRELNSYKKMMDHLFMVMSIFGIAAILLSALSGFFLAKQLLRPIRDLSAAMKKIKENGFQERMEGYKQKDELTDLSNLFNEMMDVIEQSFIQQKQFVEDASHELRTPVSVLEGHLSLLNRWGKKDPAILEESLQASLQEVTRLKKLVVDLLELTRAENLRGPFLLESIYIEPVLEQTVKNIELLHPEFQIELIIEKLLKPVRITEQHLQQILIILLDNAVKYSGKNKKIIIKAKYSVQETIITVEDFGIGIPDQNVEDIFNRFFRVDKARSSEMRGTGLGLSIAKRLVEKYKGNITVESEEGKGTKVKVVFPD